MFALAGRVIALNVRWSAFQCNLRLIHTSGKHYVLTRLYLLDGMLYLVVDNWRLTCSNWSDTASIYRAGAMDGDMGVNTVRQDVNEQQP